MEDLGGDEVSEQVALGCPDEGDDEIDEIAAGFDSGGTGKEEFFLKRSAVMAALWKARFPKSNPPWGLPAAAWWLGASQVASRGKVVG